MNRRMMVATTLGNRHTMWMVAMATRRRVKRRERTPDFFGLVLVVVLMFSNLPMLFSVLLLMFSVLLMLLSATVTAAAVAAADEDVTAADDMLFDVKSDFLSSMPFSVVDLARPEVCVLFGCFHEVCEPVLFPKRLSAFVAEESFGI